MAVAPQTPDELDDLVDALLTDALNQQNTAAILRQILKTQNASAVNRLLDGTLGGGNPPDYTALLLALNGKQNKVIARTANYYEPGLPSRDLLSLEAILDYLFEVRKATPVTNSPGTVLLQVGGSTTVPTFRVVGNDDDGVQALFVQVTDAGGRVQTFGPSVPGDTTYFTSWPGAPAGSYTAKGVLTDKQGVSTKTPAIAFTVAETTPVVTPPTPLPTAPAAPTDGRVDDIGDTFSFLPTTAYPSFYQYKVAGLPGVTGAVYLDATNSYVQGGRVYVKVVGSVPAGGLAVFVAGSGNIPDGKPLLSKEAFTGTAVVTPPTSTLKVELTSPPPTTSPDRIAISLTYLASFGSGSYQHRVVAKKSGVSYDVGSAATAEFALNWTPPSAGTFTLTDTVTDSAGAVVTSVTSTLTVTATVFSDPQYDGRPSWMPASPADVADYSVAYQTGTAPETGIAYITTNDAADTVTVFPKAGYANTLALWEVTLDGAGPGTPGNGAAAPGAPTFASLDDTANTLTLRPPAGASNDPALYEAFLNA